MTCLIRPVQQGEEEPWIELRHALYGDERAVHVAEVRSFLDGSFRWPWGALVAVEEGRLIGLAELSIRPCAEGCSTSEVAYLEGWYVRPEARGRGVGRALIEAAEAWGRSRGCRELASDTAPENRGSQAAHLACGFEDIGRTICFRKPLDVVAPRAIIPAPRGATSGRPVRPLGPTDAALARTVVERFHGAHVSESYLRGLLDAPRNLLLVAMVGDQPGGFLWAHWVDRLRAQGRQLFVYEVEVAEEHRRRGLGRRLMRAALDAAAAEGVEAFVLTHRSNAAAVALFRALGGVAEAVDDQLLVYPPGGAGER